MENNQVKKFGKRTIERLVEMDGTEIEAVMSYASIVGITGSEVWADGKIIDHLDSAQKINKLWNDFIFSEYGLTEAD